MGWSYRRSVSLGPFRVNFSKSGVGYSMGGRGFRSGVNASGRRYTSMSIPGTGLRYYKSGANSGGCLVVLATVVGSVAGVSILAALIL